MILAFLGRHGKQSVPEMLRMDYCDVLCLYEAVADLIKKEHPDS